MPRHTDILPRTDTPSASPSPPPGTATSPTAHGATAVDPAGPEPRRTFLDLSVTQLVGGALAASSAAALGARIGVGGTLLGAAIGSLVSAVAGAAYTHSLRTTRDFVLRRGRSEADAPATASAAPVTVEPAVRPPRRVALNRLNVRRVALGAAALFALVIALVTGLELATGQSLDGTKGTTVGQVTKVTKVGSNARTSPPIPADRDAKPSSSATTTGAPASSSTSPSESPSESPTSETSTTEPTAPETTPDTPSTTEAPATTPTDPAADEPPPTEGAVASTTAPPVP